MKTKPQYTVEAVKVWVVRDNHSSDLIIDANSFDDEPHYHATKEEATNLCLALNTFSRSSK